MSMYSGDGWEGWEDRAAPARADRKPPELNHITSGVVVPGLQALITGILCGVAALAVTAWFKMPYWSIAGTVGAVIMAVSWMSYRGRWQIVLENILGVDLDRNGYIGAPPQRPVVIEPETMRVELIQNEGRQGDYIDLPCREKLPQFAETVLSGRQFSQSVMVGSGKLFQRHEYDALIDALVASGLMRWRNPEHHNIGAVPTLAGKAVLKRFLPSPTGEDEQ